jgi:hypothetical protein
MSEWLTYSLSDFLLFSPRTYYRLFAIYNEAVWPVHLLAAGLAIAILWLVRRSTRWRSRAVNTILAACWLWVAVAYLLERYDSINWAARYFAIGFLFQAVLLFGLGAVLGRLTLLPLSSVFARLGLGIFIFAVVVQPLIGPFMGRPWLQAELFGLAPDPTGVAALGLVLMMRGRAAWLLMIVPLLWCAISGATLWAMEAPDALVLPVIGLVVLVLATARAWRK